jgi:hypothetical protein
MQLNLKTLLIGGALLLFVLVIGPRFFGGGDATPPQEPSVAQVQPEPTLPEAPSAAVHPAPTVARPKASPTVRPPKPTTSAAGPGAAAAPTAQAAASSASGQTWTVMLYQDADDKILEQDVYVDLNEAERTGSTDRVNIVTQMDRFKSGYKGDGNWTGAIRFYVTKDDDLTQVHSQEVGDLGEVNMSDPRTLVDFVTWAMAAYPADKYALILSDHGMGWPGGWSDGDSAASGSGNRSIPITSAIGNSLFLMDLDTALGEIRSRTGLDKFELVGMDACLMGQLEVFSALAPHARYAVASQETEPALGWAYTSFLDTLTKNPDVTGAELGRAIVKSYIEDDQRIVDPQARAELTGRGGSGFGASSQVSAKALTSQMEESITLTAVDLAGVPALIDSVNALSVALQGMNQQSVAKARSYAQTFTSIFGEQVPPSYIDLGSFVQLLKKQAGDSAVEQAADQVLSDISQLVLAEKHGPNKPGASGVAVYFPNSQLYAAPVAGPQSYTAVASRFARESQWDEFLAYHYTGRRFKPETRANLQQSGTAAVPQRSDTITAPGAGPIVVSPIRLSDDVAAPGKPIVLTADIVGKKVGYVYLYAGYLDQASNSIFMADMDYLASPDTQEVGGTYYPVWDADGRFTLKFKWEPLIFSITDGTTSTLAMLRPERYGATPEEAVYTVDGIYTYVDGESRQARLYFSNGVLHHVYGFTGDGSTGAPREILPNPGDTFTILETWLDQNGNGKPVTSATQEGKTLTFGDQPFKWKELDAAVGDYVVGFIVTDLDGNSYEQHANVTVE